MTRIQSVSSDEPRPPGADILPSSDPSLPADSLPITNMPRFRRSLLFSAIALTLTGLATPAFAQGRGAQDERPQQQAGQREGHDHDRELADAVRRAEREHRGQVLSAERVQYEGREVNRIKVIDDRGRVRVYMDDPHNPDGTPGNRSNERHDD